MTPLAHIEVISLPVRLLAELPAPCTLTLRVPGLEAVYGRHALPSGAEGPALPVLLTTSRPRAQEAAQAAREGGSTGGEGEHVVCLTPVEYEALAVALADGRVRTGGPGSGGPRNEAHHLLASKAKAAREGRELRLTPERLLGPVCRPDGGGEAWTIGELLEALGASLEGVEVEGEVAGG